MSNYTKLVNFAAKDSLPSGDAGKLIKGTEINTELNNIATAVNSKADSNSSALTGTPTAPTAAEGTNTTQIATTAYVYNLVGGLTATPAELNVLDGITATTAELNVLDGITATTAELNYVDGVTSNIQTQLNDKAALASPALTGTPTAPTAASGSNTTQIATTAFVTAAVGSTSTDLVLDTSPQLGGNLASNGSDIEMADNDKIKLGTSGDLEMYHNGTDTVIADTGTGILKYTSSEAGPAGVVFEIENTSGVSGAGSFVQFKDGTVTPAKVGGVGGAFYVLSGTDNSYVLLANPQGATTLTYAGIETLETTATGIEVSGTITATGGNSTNWNTAYSWGDHASAGYLDESYQELAQNAQNANYTLVLADSGKHLYHSDGTAYTWTIPPNSSVAYPIGTVITMINDASANVNITIARGSGVAVIFEGVNQNCTLGRYGVATIIKVGTDRWYITGSELA